MYCIVNIVIIEKQPQLWKFGIFMANKITDMLPPDVESNDTLYIVDRELKVVYTNEEWARFASENKGGRILGKDWNSNLLENMSGREKERWKHIYRLLLEGRVPHHKENFILMADLPRALPMK